MFFQRIKSAGRPIILLAALLVLVSLALSVYLSQRGNFQHQELSINIPTPLSIDPRHIAMNPSLESEIDPYKKNSTFISEEKVPGFEFTTMAIAWEQFTPEGTGVDVEARFKVEGVWSEWMQIDPEDDFAYNPDPNTKKKFGMASSNPATTAQYKFVMEGNGEQSPYIKSQDITFLKTAKYSIPEVPKALFSAVSSDELELIESTSLSDGVISRAEWGANESYRYLSDNTSTPHLIDLSDDFYEKYGDELTVASVVEQDQEGNRYKWPLKYPQDIEKIIIHHTATSADLDNPAQAIKDIYYYHSISRGWGDIGYNYIVDQEGQIYEGRYGGEGVIGAHAGPGNHGSIGVAVLGNYESSPVPEKVLLSLSQLIHKKAKIHGFNPAGYSDFRGEVRNNIFGHNEMMSTTCPGQNLNEQFSTLRVMAQNAFEVKPKFVKDYEYQDLSEIFYVQMKPEESRELTFNLENIGNESWDSHTGLVFTIGYPGFEVVDTPELVGTSYIYMEENSVAPGETATFKVLLEAKRNGGIVELSLTPTIDGNRQLSQFKIPLKVEQPVYKYEVTSFSKPNSILKVGANIAGAIKLKNVGNISWEKSGDKKVVLLGKNSGLELAMSEDTVAPGETGTFLYQTDAPSTVGTFYEEFYPIMDNAIWSAGDTLSIYSNIYERDFDGEVFSKSILTSAERNIKHKITVQLRNLGKNSWTEENLKLLFLKNPDIYISELAMTPQTVKIGETAKLQFSIKPANTAQENQVLFIQPKVNGLPIIRRPIRYEFKLTDPVTVQPSTDNSEEDIRIKLSFSEAPQITANGQFSLYSGNTFMESLNAGDLVSITRASGKFEIETPSKTYEKTSEIRVVPSEGSILEIVNFEHRPTWNLELNDNRYRGIIEVDYRGGEYLLINELPLESYMRGIAEMSNDEETEKIKAVMIAARSYAYYYMTVDEKFPGETYHLDDNPDISQKYLGYGFEIRAPKVINAITQTTGEIVSYDGEVIKTPYFNQSDGSVTKSAEEVWGWTHTPYLISVDDSFCEGNQFYGHGVGLSGCGAKEMALRGYSYQEILNHYYTNINITKIP